MTTSRRDFLRRSVALAATLGTPAVLAACGDDDETSSSGSGTTAGGSGATSTTARELERLTVMMPFPISMNFIADVTAKSAGFMEEEGIDLDLQFSQSAPQALQQLAAGNVTIIRNGPLETVLAVIEQDAPFITIGMPNQRTHYTLTTLPEQPLGLADLGGRTVGLPTLGANAEFVFDIVVEAAGVDPSTVQKQAVGNEASAYGVMQEGVVDALFVSRSAIAGIRALGEEPNVDTLDNANPLLGTNLVTTTQFLEERHDVIVRYLAALHATMTALHDETRRAELIPIVAADDRWELPQLDDAATASNIIGATAGQWFQEGEENLLRNVPERWAAGVEELIRIGVLPEGTDPTDHYTNEPLEEALA